MEHILQEADHEPALELQFVSTDINPYREKPDDDEYIRECREHPFCLVVEPTDSVLDTFRAVCGNLPWEAQTEMVFCNDKKMVAGGHRVETWFWFDHSTPNNTEYITIVVYKNYLSRADQMKVRDDSSQDDLKQSVCDHVIDQLAIDISDYDGKRFQKFLERKIRRGDRNEYFPDTQSVTGRDLIQEYQAVVSEFSAISQQMDTHVETEVLQGQTFTEAYRSLINVLNEDLAHGIQSTVLSGLQNQLHELAVRAEKLEGLLQKYFKKYLKLPENQQTDLIGLLKGMAVTVSDEFSDESRLLALVESGDVNQIFEDLQISHDEPITEAEQEMFLALLNQVLRRRNQQIEIAQLGSDIELIRSGYRTQLRDVVIDLIAEATPGQKMAQAATLAYRLTRQWVSERFA